MKLKYSAALTKSFTLEECDCNATESIHLSVSSEKEEVATVLLTRCDPHCQSDDTDIQHALDALNNSANTEIWEMLTYGELFYLNKIIIHRPCRGQGIGSEIMKNLPEILRRITGQLYPVIVLIPGAIEVPFELTSARAFHDERVYRFYSRLGYRAIKGTKVMYNYEDYINRQCDYQIGDRIVLTHMVDDPYPVPDGTRGTVHSVDDMGHIHVRWDNGSGLAVIPGVDKFRLLTRKEREEQNV